MRLGNKNILSSLSAKILSVEGSMPTQTTNGAISTTGQKSNTSNHYIHLLLPLLCCYFVEYLSINAFRIKRMKKKQKQEKEKQKKCIHERITSIEYEFILKYHQNAFNHILSLFSIAN